MREQMKWSPRTTKLQEAQAVLDATLAEVKAAPTGAAHAGGGRLDFKVVVDGARRRQQVGDDFALESTFPKVR